MRFGVRWPREAIESAWCPVNTIPYSSLCSRRILFCKDILLEQGGQTSTLVQVKHVRNVMAHAQKPDLVFQRNGRVHLNRLGCQFSRLLAVEECGSADCNCIDRVPTYSARLLATHSIRIFPLHFPSHASSCAIRFRTRYTTSASKLIIVTCISYTQFVSKYNLNG